MMRFPIGTRFIRLGKRRSVETVVDYHVTRNLAGEIVRARYVCAREFCGQIVTDADVTETMIARGEILP